MIVAVPRERVSGERRVALVPDAVKTLVAKKVVVRVEAGAGAFAGFSDEEFERAGAECVPSSAALLTGADVLLRLQPPSDAELEMLCEGQTLIGLLKPLDRPKVAAALARRRLTSFALELVPRITRAQSMDVLSSQATIAGYHAVLRGASALPKIFPMLTTAAGTIAAARVLVIGAGVAGLQAIATARRLGAAVEAYDTRPAVKEQVQSLGARFVELELDTKDAEGAGGYAKAQDEAFYLRQRQLLGARMRGIDLVITTALVPGRRAPLLIDEEAVRGMRAGSVIVDLAAENGGNCAVTRAGEDVVVHGVTVCGVLNAASAHPTHASQLFARNVVTFLTHLSKDGVLVVDREDEITKGSLVTHGGELVNAAVSARLAEEGGAE